MEIKFRTPSATDATRPNTRQLVLLVNLDERAVAATELLPGTHLCGNQISAAHAIDAMLSL